MKVIKEGSVYLVHSASEVVAACRACVPNHVRYYTNDQMFMEEAVYGDKELPKVYPYVLVCNFIDDSCFAHIDVFGITADHFENRGEDAKEHLFYFRIRRTQNVSPYVVKETDYQMPGRDILEATMKVGQTFHRDEEYDLEILNWKLVH